MSSIDSDRLSRISTHWSLVLCAHDATSPDKKVAQGVLLHRYCGAVYRYVFGIVRDEHVADDLCQEFAHRFVRGDFHKAHPAVGRFRNFVRTAVIHMIADWRRRGRAGPRMEPAYTARLEDVNSREPDPAEQFEALWRAELLDQAWERLEQLQEEVGRESNWYYIALRFQAEHPEASSADIAAALSRELHRPITVDNVRTTLKRARAKFADALVAEVARSLQSSDPDEVEAEVTELGLLPYCQSALDKRERPGHT